MHVLQIQCTITIHYLNTLQTGIVKMGISRIEHFIATITKTPLNEIEKACNHELNYLRRYYEPSSMRRAVTNYRNAVRNAGFESKIETVIIKKLVLSEVEKILLANQKSEQLTHDLTTLRPLRHIDEMIQIATALLSENSYLKQVIGLCVLTGRRSAEIGCTAHFEAIENDPFKIMFTGQLKTKGRGELAAFEIPVLCESHKIIEALNALRLKKPQYVNNPEKFHKSLSKDLGINAKKAFNFVTDDSSITVKDLRSIYAEINYFLADNRTIAKSKFMSMILGHDENDNETGLSYVDFYIDDENYI